MMVDSQHFAVKEIGAMHDQVARDFLEKQQQKEAVAQRTAGAQRRLQELLAQRERAEHRTRARARALCELRAQPRRRGGDGGLSGHAAQRGLGPQSGVTECSLSANVYECF